jgi:hypothetical protein
LCELEDGLLRFTLEPPEGLDQQRSHPVGDVVLFEERRPVDLVRREVCQTQDGVAFGRVERALARNAELLESLHHGSLAFMRRDPRIGLRPPIPERV